MKDFQPYLIKKNTNSKLNELQTFTQNYILIT